MWGLFLVIGLIFSPIATAMAFAITYEEWGHHQLPHHVVLGRSLHAAGVTLGFFVLLCLGVGYLVTVTGTFR